MERAGLSVRMDAAGTMRGALPPGDTGRSANKALLIGSHIDTVIDAGRYDGNLGVVAAILAHAGGDAVVGFVLGDLVWDFLTLLRRL